MHNVLVGGEVRTTMGSFRIRVVLSAVLGTVAAMHSAPARAEGHHFHGASPLSGRGGVEHYGRSGGEQWGSGEIRRFPEHGRDDWGRGYRGWHEGWRERRWGGPWIIPYGVPAYPYGYYYSYPSGVVEPPIVIDPGSSRYYCQSADAYYPEVTACPEGWTVE